MIGVPGLWGVRDRLPLGAYFLSKLARSLLQLLCLLVISFLMIHFIPGSPLDRKAHALSGMGSTDFDISGGERSEVSEQWVNLWRQHYGFHRPLAERFYYWIKGLFIGNLGESYSFEEPVIDLIWERLPVTLHLGLWSLLICYFVSLPLAFLLSRIHNSQADQGLTFLISSLSSFSPLVIGIWILLFVAKAELQVVWPIATCAISGAPSAILLLKNTFLDLSQRAFVKHARARGLSSFRIGWFYFLRPAVYTLIQSMSNYLIFYFASSMVIESIFRINGLGILSYQSIIDRDYNLLMGIILFQIFLVLFVRGFSDLFCFLLSPQKRTLP